MAAPERFELREAEAPAPGRRDRRHPQPLALLHVPPGPGRERPGLCIGVTLAW
jgi:hypothetical protein